MISLFTAKVPTNKGKKLITTIGLNEDHARRLIASSEECKPEDVTNLKVKRKNYFKKR